MAPRHWRARQWTAVRSAVAALAALLVLAGLTACSHSGSGARGDVTAAAQKYLDALGRADAGGAAGATTDPGAAESAIAATLVGLGDGARAEFAVTSVSHVSKTAADVAYRVSWRLPGVAAPWTYSASLPVSRSSASGQPWLVSWRAQDVQPNLTDGTHLVVVRTQPPRAALEDDAGAALFTPTPVVDVTLVPGQITDLPGEAATLAGALGLSVADIIAVAQATPAGGSTTLITLRQPDYEQVKAKIHELPGVQFPTRTALLGPTRAFAQPLLGTVGPATKEIIDGSKGTIVAGDSVGLSGLQRAYDARLRGVAGVAIYAATADPNATPVKISQVSEPKPGTPIRLTLNRTDQTAAESALAGVTLPAAIVITQPSTGKVLAVANSAAASPMGDIAIDGQFPPGSVFKIATYTAAFTADPTRNPNTTAPCPGTTTVNGQTVRNENNFIKGSVSFASAFAFSCNTTAATIGLTLPPGALVNAAKSLGLGQDWSSFPVEAFSGSLPEPATPNELAADAYGQGKVLVSPLLMAEIAGGFRDREINRAIDRAGHPKPARTAAEPDHHRLPQHDDARRHHRTRSHRPPARVPTGRR